MEGMSPEGMSPEGMSPEGGSPKSGGDKSEGIIHHPPFTIHHLPFSILKSTLFFVLYLGTIQPKSVLKNY